MSISSSILRLSLAILIVTIAGVAGIFTYIAVTNPNVNHIVQSQHNSMEREAFLAEVRRYNEWRYSNHADVAVSDENYPLVVLRTGYKAIDFDVDKQEVTLGWIYDIANTSQRESYMADVTFHLTDRDQFKVVTMNESTFMRNQSFETIRGTTTMGINDLKRINNDTWSISLTPNWSSDTSTGTRMERLTELTKTVNPPWWLRSEFVKNNLTSLAEESEKWQAVLSGFKLKE